MLKILGLKISQPVTKITNQSFTEDIRSTLAVVESFLLEGGGENLVKAKEYVI